MATQTPPPPATDNFSGDPFQHTTMTFGEHLDELRICLFKAVLSLAIGFCVGMFFGKEIVNSIQAPLTKALKQHVQEKSLRAFREELAERAKHGDRSAEAALADPQLEKLVYEHGMLPEEVYVAPREMLSELKKQFPQSFDKIDLQAAEHESPAKSEEKSAAPSDETAEKSGQNLPGATIPLAKSDLLPMHIWRPVAKDDHTKLISTGSQETFMIWIKASFLGGAIISSPFVFYFLWSFVAAGLYSHEKHYVNFFLPFSIGLFLLGAALAFFFVFPPVLSFFFGYNDDFNVSLELRISEWLSFLVLMTLGFGISFQLPLVMLFLERIGIVTVDLYISKWRIAVLALAILAAIGPGGDPMSMMYMFIPLLGLYFAGIGLCKWLPSAPRQSRLSS